MSDLAGDYRRPTRSNHLAPTDRQATPGSPVDVPNSHASGNTLSRDSPPKLRVLLVGNYVRDGQESMQRFAAAMLAGLQESGIGAELLLPPVWLGRAGSSSAAGLGKWLSYLDKFGLFPILLRRVLNTMRHRHPGDEIVVHVCDHSNAIYTRYLQKVPHLVTCHDLLAVRSARGEFPQNPTRWSGRLLQELILSGIRRSPQIVCDSEATRKDVLRLTGLPAHRISMIPVALNYPYSPMPPAEARRRVVELGARAGVVELGDSFLLHVGGNQWYKNRPAVIRIHAELSATRQNAPWLVLVGRGVTAEMESALHHHPARQRVVFIEGCSNEDLRALYSVADALLFPSLAEGFGWPLVEAQACGCPVVCSSIAPLPEVAGDAALYCNVQDEAAFARQITTLLSQPDLRETLVQRGFANVKRFQLPQMIAAYVRTYRAFAST